MCFSFGSKEKSSLDIKTRKIMNKMLRQPPSLAL